MLAGWLDMRFVLARHHPCVPATAGVVAELATQYIHMMKLLM